MMRLRPLGSLLLLSAACSGRIHSEPANARVEVDGSGAKVDCGASALTFVVPPGFDGGAPLDYPWQLLRGYGNVAGQFWTLTSDAGAGSVLIIFTQDESHAALTHAKYLSDLQSLGGVAAEDLAGLPGWSAGGQGHVLALAAGTSVAILTGATPAELISLYGGLSGPSMRSFQASVPVPPYLDRWDKHGFNFYYATNRAFGEPNPLSDFDYAQAHGGTGFAIWDGPLRLANGLTGSGSSLWPISAAETRGLPVVLNTAALGYSMPRYLRDRYQGMGVLPERSNGFHGTPGGNQYSDYFGEGTLPWGGGIVEDDVLGAVQADIRTYGSHPNVVSILEPHAEMSQTATGIFGMAGPAGDAKFRAFLQTRYASISALSTAWYGDPGAVSSWDAVQVPELADFAGRDAQALDVSGPWRMSASQPTGNGVPPWAAPDFDDSQWANVANDDHLLFMPTGALALRASFTAAGQSFSFLYVWQENWNCSAGSVTRAFMDGSELPLVFPDAPGWAVYGVSSVSAGDHLLALATAACTGGHPLGYRVYFSSTAPSRFPRLPQQQIVRWVDFDDWYAAAHGISVANGMNMIRQVQPDKPIELMAPNLFADLLKADAEDFGGSFHDTGFMSGFWINLLPGLMRSSNLPVSVEPGNPAPDVPSFKRFIAHWLTEGVNGINYFLHIGDVIGNPAIEAEYRANLPMLEALGKHHIPHGQVAQLQGYQSLRTQSFPWGGDPNLNLRNGSPIWALDFLLADEFDMDSVTELDFTRGNAAGYRVIIDSNTSFMTPETVAAIEAWVRAGGTFITFIQTGRHGIAGADTWPIASLTGYGVQSIDRYVMDMPAPAAPLTEVPGQTLLSHRWGGRTANGIHLQRQAPDVQDVLQWPDMTTAVGVRPVGAGQVVTLGAKFANDRIWWGTTTDTVAMFEELLAYAGVSRVAGDMINHATRQRYLGPNLFRHSVSNNGVFDVWTVSTGATAIDVDLEFRTSPLPTTALDVLTGNTVALAMSGDVATLGPVHLNPDDTRMYLTPKNALDRAPQAWFELQRGWWQGTTPPRKAPYDHLSGNEMPFGPEFPLSVGGSGSGFSSTVSIPDDWATGRIELWIADTGADVFLAQGTVSIDGQSVAGPTSAAIMGLDVTANLPPGSHTVEVSVSGGTTPITGVRGTSWLRHVPAPIATIDLSGTWSTSADGFSFGGGTSVPGPWAQGSAGIRAISRDIVIPDEWSGNRVLLSGRFQVCTGASDLLVNGKWYAGAGTWALASRIDVDITAAINFGQSNIVEIHSFPSTPVYCAGTAIQSLQLIESVAP